MYIYHQSPSICKLMYAKSTSVHVLSESSHGDRSRQDMPDGLRGLEDSHDHHRGPEYVSPSTRCLA